MARRSDHSRRQAAARRERQKRQGARSQKPQAAKSGTNKKAVFAFVAGLVGFVVPLAAPAVAIASGVVARREIAADPEQSGERYAMAGIILGAIGIPIGIAFLVIFVF